jgi:membrane-associated phospholipid phosphatase
VIECVAAVTLERSSMRRLGQVLIVLALAATALVAAAGRLPHWPGDIAVTRFVQGLSRDTAWAETVTKSASAPWSFGLVALAAAIAWWLAGWRAAVAIAVAFGSMWWIGDWVKPVIGRPRPSPAFVSVTGSPRGFSFPSTFALVYATTVGALALVAAFWSRRGRKGAIVAAAVALLVLGGLARIALGAHWPSDILVSYLVGLVWSAILLRLAAGAPTRLNPRSASRAGFRGVP